jgi:hypothetical protein
MKTSSKDFGLPTSKKKEREKSSHRKITLFVGRLYEM